MAEKCDTHHKQHRTVNLTLFSLLGIGLAFLVWHVVQHGPTNASKAAVEGKSIITLLGMELWDLLTGGHGFIAELGDIWLYFLIGILIAGYIRTYKFHIRMRKTLIKYGFISIVIASFIGVFSPLCSCGILATVIGLLASGLPLAPAMALLISSPLMSPTAFFLTIGDLGSEWTVVRVLVAFTMGIFAGVVTHIFRKHFPMGTLFVDGSIPEGDFHDADYGDERLRCTCREKFSNRVARKHPNKFIIFCAKTLEMSWMIGKYVLVGIFVGCIAERYIPRPFINNLFGERGGLNIIWITLGSIPIFLHQISASSILYHIQEALPGTMDKGAGLAFLIGGPVTAIPAMTLLWAMFKKRVFVLYMAISLLGTIFFAYGFKWFVFVPNVNSSSPVFASVSNLPSGEGAVLEKSHQYVHMLADPERQGLIALYQDIEGGSGIAFDASLTRFNNDSLDVLDNNSYIKNLAKWLDNTSLTTVKKKILVFNTYAGAGYGKADFDRNITSVLKNPHQVTVTDREETPRLSPDLLSQYNQLWIINGSSDQSGRFDEDEIFAIRDFRDSGGSILIAAGPSTAQRDHTLAANQVAGLFGVTFNNTRQAQQILPVSITGKFFGRAAEELLPYYDYMRRLRDSSDDEHDHAHEE